MKPIKIHLPLRPITASRPRVPRFGKPYFAKTYKTWRDAADGLLPEYIGVPIAHPVKATVLFAIPRAKTSTLTVPSGDGDNFEKAVYDLLQRKKYLEDDKWLVSATWKKRFLPYGSEGYSSIILEDETDDINIGE